MVYTHSMRAGLYLGAAFVMLELIDRYAIARSDMSLFVLNKMMYMIVVMSLVVIFTRKYVDEELDGQGSYSKVLSYGTFLFFFAAMIYAFFFYVYVSVFNPNAIIQERDFYLGVFEMVLDNPSDYPQAYVDMLNGEMDNYKHLYEEYCSMSHGKVALNAISTYALRGFAFCLVSSIFLRRKTKRDNANDK